MEAISEGASKLEQCDKSSLSPLVGFLEAFFWEKPILLSGHVCSLLLMDTQVFLPKEEGYVAKLPR